MARVAVTELQRRGALANGWGLYDLKSGWRGAVMYGLPGLAKGLAAMRSNPNYGLGAGCPEGSHLVNGECVCYEGRVWMPDRSKCVSPQSPAYIQAVGGGPTTYENQSSFTSKQWGQQSLTDSARRYIESRGHRIDCMIDPNWVASPAGGDPAMLCSIDGGPYIYAAYAINQNPYNVLNDLARQKAVEQVSQQTGIDPGSLYTSPETSQAVTNAMTTGAVDAGAAATAQEAYQAKQQLLDSLVPGVDYDQATGAALSWRAEVAGSNRVELPLVYEALRLPPGFQLSSTGGVIPSTGAGASAGDSGGGILGGIPTWLLLAGGAFAVYSMTKN